MVLGAACSMKGAARKKNEDCYFIDTMSRTFIIADGMGGAPAGEVASELACRLLSQQLSPLSQSDFDPERTSEELQKVFHDVNELIFAQRGMDPRFQRMGTSAISAMIRDDQLLIADVGNSRAYLIRDAVASQLSIDHTIAQVLVDAGLLSSENARMHPYRKILCQYLGGKDSALSVHLETVPLHRKDRLLLTTNGLTDRIDDTCLARVISRSSSPDVAARELVQLAFKNNSKDDTTCVVIFIE